MAKAKNHVLYPKTETALYALKQEYEWLGREVVVSEDANGKKLIVLALPKKYARKSKAEAKMKAKREDRESYDRPSQRDERQE